MKDFPKRRMRWDADGSSRATQAGLGGPRALALVLMLSASPAASMGFPLEGRGVPFVPMLPMQHRLDGAERFLMVRPPRSRPGFSNPALSSGFHRPLDQARTASPSGHLRNAGGRAVQAVKPFYPSKTGGGDGQNSTHRWPPTNTNSPIVVEPRNVVPPFVPESPHRVPPLWNRPLIDGGPIATPTPSSPMAGSGKTDPPPPEVSPPAPPQPPHPIGRNTPRPSSPDRTTFASAVAALAGSGSRAWLWIAIAALLVMSLFGVGGRRPARKSRLADRPILPVRVSVVPGSTVARVQNCVDSPPPPPSIGVRLISEHVMYSLQMLQAAA
jgi:hypothetical protein